ncbi:guanine deaminase [Paucilactobacillus suebicus]|uniref:Guanine deaminase n=1 Tax=Paucilactobacillus suebicus DSM 5007 = KCTC 3549 TaxID=1423807 RepID=A0A0R1WFG5_9LACO|nr:guanine deaminase [Paucilactobacillus suebicus]KRM12764.1 guanine deaminase [Paucilactobacillus suebicus DSM 5007 = KCTC 3549]
MNSQVIEGTYYSSVSCDQIKYAEDALICVDETGIIQRIVNHDDPQYGKIRRQADQNNSLTILASDEYLLPGLIDLHVHAPQWAQAGLALDKPLNEWLNTYTFPLESKFSDLNFSRRVYSQLVMEMVANGTTTVMFFGTIFNESNLVLAKQCSKFGLRGFIGKVAMDNPEQTPEYYRDLSAKQALLSTEEFIFAINELQAKNGGTLVPVITPRFVPSCTDELLAGLGKLAQKYDLPIQSHCSESDWEHNYAKERFKMHDAEVLDHFGLLTDRSVMAHGTMIDENDQQLFYKRQAAVAHCPISNVYFGNSVFPTKRMLEHGNKVGLGTDISGGYSPSLYRNMQQAVMSSQMLQDGVDQSISSNNRGVNNSRISIKNAFYLATRGGAEALHLKTGSIEVGMQADFQIVKSRLALLKIDPNDQFERLIYQTDRNDIKQVFIGGKLVYQN